MHSIYILGFMFNIKIKNHFSCSQSIFWLQTQDTRKVSVKKGHAEDWDVQYNDATVLLIIHKLSYVMVQHNPVL